MFTVEVDGKTICNSAIEESMISNPIVTLEANKAGSFTFSIDPFHEAYNVIANRSSTITVKRNGEIVFQGFSTTVREDFLKNRYFTCEGELSYLNDSILRQHKYENQTVLSLLTAYINEHNAQVDPKKQFEVGQVMVNGGSSIFRYTNMQSTMVEINEDLIDNFGGFIRLRYEDGHKYIDYLAESPRFNTQVIELGKNLLDYNSNIDDTGIATIIIPQGVRLDEAEIEGLDKYLDIKSVNGGLDCVTAEASVIERYGKISKVQNWDDVTIPSILKSKAEQFLTDTQFGNVTIECSALDFGELDPNSQTFRILDNVRIISSAHGMDRVFTLTKMTLNLAQPESDTFTFGKVEKTSLTSQTTKSASKIEKRIPMVSDVLEKAQQNASSIIAGAEGGYVLIDTDENEQPWRILIMDNVDKDTAINVIQLNRNGIGFSNNGVNGMYRNAWTIDGNLVADFITTGNLVGLNINNGNNTFKVDSNGNMTANSGAIGMWNIATNADDKGALYADNGNFRIWLHSGGADETGNKQVCFGIKYKQTDGTYKYRCYMADDGTIAGFNSNIVNTYQIHTNNSINTGGLIGVRNSDADMAVQLTTDTSKNGSVSVFGANQKAVNVLASSSSGGYSNTYNTSGVTSTTCTTTASGGYIAAYGNDGTPRGVLGVSANSSGYLSIRNSNNKDSAVLGTNSNNNGYLNFNDSNGATYMGLYKTSDGAVINFQNNHWVGRNANGTAIQASGYRLVMQDDGNLVIYNPSGKAIWDTGTNGK